MSFSSAHSLSPKPQSRLQLSGVTRGSDENLNNVQLRQTRVSVCEYEEIQLTNDPPIYSLPRPVSDEDDAPVYALALNVSDNLNYSTIRFTDHSAKTSPAGQTTSDYATVIL
ncbi:uncharacterized protein [Misgurnus anguillicaudatus]|uniref:uncharacterized protein isoform X2 n=1 Tax=Misgurnus anguillicaudatus TaxID=75329 RepID=UPI003CCF6C4F